MNRHVSDEHCSLFLEGSWLAFCIVGVVALRHDMGGIQGDLKVQSTGQVIRIQKEEIQAVVDTLRFRVLVGCDLAPALEGVEDGPASPHLQGCCYVVDGGNLTSDVSVGTDHGWFVSDQSYTILSILNCLVDLNVSNCQVWYRCPYKILPRRIRRHGDCARGG